MEALTQEVGDSDESRTEGDASGATAGGSSAPSSCSPRCFVFLFASAAAFVGYLGYTVNDNVTHADAAAREPARRSRPPTAPRSPRRAPAPTSSSSAPTPGPVTPAAPTSSCSCTSPRTARRSSMIHFPRDLYVDIPGPRQEQDQRRVRLRPRAAARRRRWRTCSRSASTTSPRPTSTGFENMTDAVGGVRVYAEEASNGTGNGGPVVIKKGWNDLNGEQALGFVRERYTLSEGDISRGRRQLAFIKALMLKAIEPARRSPTRSRSPSSPTPPPRTSSSTRTSRSASCATTPSRCATSGPATSSSRPRRSPASAPHRPAPPSTSSTSKGMADLGEALRTDTMDDYGDVFVTP